LGRNIGHLTDSQGETQAYNRGMTSASASPAGPPAPLDPISLAVAGRLIDALAARDFDAAVGTLAPEVRFRALLPRREVEVTGRGAVRSTLDTWFGAAEQWEMVEAVVGEVGGRIHLRWRVRLTNPVVGPGTFIVEQQAYTDADGEGRLDDVALLCSGYRPDRP
jgi:hypothetical protein